MEYPDDDSDANANADGEEQTYNYVWLYVVVGLIGVILLLAMIWCCVVKRCCTAEKGIAFRCLCFTVLCFFFIIVCVCVFFH